MDDFIESMNSENLNKIETLLKTFKDNSNDDNNNNNNTTLMNAENIPKYLIETKLLSEENKKSKYELLMDLIDDFLELRDGFETRMIDIEKKLKELKPELSSIDTRLNPDDFSTDDYLQSSDDNDIEKE